MRTAKDLLLQECSSLKEVLDETLRFKYGLHGSKEFFEECQTRLIYITDELANTADSDFDNLQNIGVLLSQLSALISRIERSSIGEYSWPFVTELTGIAVALCSEPTLTNPDTPPEIHILSGGGLDSYAIQPELTRPSGSRKRIHTIVFPRTLKHFVLLHAILGHEIGHAMWRCSQHQASLKQIVTRELFDAGPFSSVDETARWLYSKDTPNRVKQQLAGLHAKGIDKSNFFNHTASWSAWLEEILCDFIGLLTFGPSFVAAECNLLYALDPAGMSLGPRHPPVGCRTNYLLTAASLLGFDQDEFAAKALKSKVTTFWATLNDKRKAEPWFDVFRPQQLLNTVHALNDLLLKLPPSLYVLPTEEELGPLVKQLAAAVPPVGFRVDGDTVSCSRVDFRHALYAGWITVATPPADISFSEINRLCEHGIMQQYAINMQLDT